jgi:hypothetical protein
MAAMICDCGGIVEYDGKGERPRHGVIVQTVYLFRCIECNVVLRLVRD